MSPFTFAFVRSNKCNPNFLPVFSDGAITDDSIQNAVDLWLENETEAVQLYGPIGSWGTSNVTDMSNCTATRALLALSESNLQNRLISTSLSSSHKLLLPAC